ncbi:ABC transporter ATP-binding protein [Oleidesulfovibrio sp.]|uniref:ABC transporter ATP-binding protein n=1 Tax=Oleidesulfovibrio sp. TaxID=2909707 RepID=UPI003A84BD3D
MTDVAISIRGVSKAFGAGDNVHYALRNIDLDIRHREILMLMGPSGSGKTTLLSIMGGILTPTSGDIAVDGVSMSKLSQRQLAQVRLSSIGFIFQEYNLFPTLDCIGNLLVALDLRGIRGTKAKAIAMQRLEDVGMSDKAAEYPAKLSGGQKQRLAIARALAGDPRVLLADEPTAALDSENGLRIMALLQALAREHGRAVVIVTHDNRITRFADRVVRIEDGRLHTARTPEEAS